MNHLGLNILVPKKFKIVTENQLNIMTNYKPFFKFLYQSGLVIIQIITDEWRNWHTRTVQNRVSQEVRVQLPPRPQKIYFSK